jgi:hypothetical protein
MGCLACCLQVLHCLDHRSERFCHLTVTCRSQTCAPHGYLDRWHDAELRRRRFVETVWQLCYWSAAGSRWGSEKQRVKKPVCARRQLTAVSILCSCSLCCVGRTQPQSTSARVVECAYGMASTLSAASSCTIRPGQMTNNVQLLSEL